MRPLWYVWKRSRIMWMDRGIGTYSCVDSNGSFAACSSYEFIISLVITGNGLSIARPVTAKLQYNDTDIVKAY